ncbi:MAG: hypothetical protein KDC95_18500 [Planctomycetes bacterium]|nr:hypothetical protein [Planctomycetota bacterium]
MVKKSSFLEKLFARKKVEDRSQTEVAGRGSRVSPPSRQTGDRPTGSVTGGNVRPSDRLGERDATPVPQRASRIIPAPAEKPASGAKPEAKAEVAAPKPAAPAAPRVTPEAPKPAPAARPEPSVKRAEKPLVIDGGRVASGSGISRVLGTKSREEAAQALTDGFRELGNLLQGIHRRMDDQSRQATGLNDKFVGLPDMAKAQVDFMAKVSQQLVEQKEKTGELLDKLSGLPALLDGIHKTLERQAAVEERTEKNLRDFRSTMDRIHNSIGELQSQSQSAMTKATETFERTNGRTTRVFEETQKQAYETFQKTQEQSLAQLAKIVEKSGKANRGVTIVLSLLLVAFVGLAIFVITK